MSSEEIYENDDIENDEEESSSEDIINLFKPEEERMHRLYDELDELYAETKQYFDSVVRAKGRGTLNFIQSQTSNLISIKQSKISLVKEMAGIKKLAIELDHKVNKGTEGISSKDAELVNKFFEEADNPKHASSFETDDFPDDYEEESYEDQDDSALSERFNELVNDGSITMSENDLAMKYENVGARLVVYLEDERKPNDWEFMAVDREYNILDDYPIPDKSLYEMTITQDKAGNFNAKDQNDRDYEVVS